MTIGTTAKARVYIGSANATISELADFEADTYLEINDVIDLGEWGPEAKVLEYTRLSDAHVRRLKGSIDSGSIKLIVARNTTDAGQNKARAAVEDYLPYAIKIELNDKPTPDGENTVFYMRAVVGGAQNEFKEADNIVKTTINLGIDGAILEIPAAPTVTITPSSGPLPGATSGSAYSETIAASGGIGTKTFAISAGALPAGLALNVSTGVISGTPSATGSATFSVSVTYSGGGEAEADYTLSIT